MVKEVSGERLLKAGDKEYVLRFDFAAVAEIESRLGKSIVDVIVGMTKSPKLSDVTVLFAAAAKIDTEEAWSVLSETGFGQATEKIVDALEATLNPKGFKPGNRKARTAKAA